MSPGAGTDPSPAAAPGAGGGGSGEVRVELLPGLSLALRLEPGGVLRVAVLASPEVRALRVEVPPLEVAAAGSLVLRGEAVEIASGTHLDARAEGQVRLWGEDVVEDPQGR
ncbi:hypothetical protein L6R50_06855 [Myxococcota bacterium]|nr:hypothetical protein [Myxococcota bacterium]